MRVSVFYNELYRACPEAKEEVTAKGGPKKWASSSFVHTASVSGQMISIAPTPPQPKKRQPVIHKVVLYKPQSSVKLGITLTSSNDGAVRITGINAGGIAATVPLLQVDQYVIAINGEEVRDHSSATSLLQAAVGNVNLKVTHSRPLTATGMPSKSGRSDNSEPRGGKGTGLCPSFQSTGSCKFGTKCKFKHDGRTERANIDAAGHVGKAQVPSHNPLPMAQVSEDVAKFWKRLQTAVDGGIVKVGALQLHEPRNRQQWLACWAAAAAGVTSGSHEVLIKVLLLAPAKMNIAPPALDVVQVLSHVAGSSGECV